MPLIRRFSGHNPAAVALARAEVQTVLSNKNSARLWRGTERGELLFEKDLVIDGNVSSAEGGIEIKGKVTGDITADAVLVQTGGSTKGTLSAKQITIEGDHTGSLTCDELKLGTASTVNADVKAKTMAAESGVKINGKIKVTG